MGFHNIDLAKYINGFKIEADKKELNISPRDVRTAIDAISFKLLPMEVLPFIPSTISPCKSSDLEGYLEHPSKAFEEYSKMGAKKIIGELKHMGSRAVILAFKDKDSAMKYTSQPKTTIIYSRRGLAFFRGADEEYICSKIQDLLKVNNYFEKNNTDFVLMDTEILPWNAKGSGLLTNQYLPVLDSSKSLNLNVLNCLNNIEGLEPLKDYVQNTMLNIYRYEEQLENYCWDTDITNIKIAPFHVLAHKNKTFFDKKHEWHLNHFNELINMKENDLFVETPYIIVDLESEESMSKAIKFWLDVTTKGYEGVMFKTETFIETNDNGDTILPMMKVRGKDYLRIIYGINYDDKKYLDKLKNRSVSKKRFLHYKQTALAIESVKLFANGESLEKWHDYVFAGICLGNMVTDHRL